MAPASRRSALSVASLEALSALAGVLIYLMLMRPMPAIIFAAVTRDGDIGILLRAAIVFLFTDRTATRGALAPSIRRASPGGAVVSTSISD